MLFVFSWKKLLQVESAFVFCATFTMEVFKALLPLRSNLR